MVSANPGLTRIRMLYMTKTILKVNVKVAETKPIVRRVCTGLVVVGVITFQIRLWDNVCQGVFNKQITQVVLKNGRMWNVLTLMNAN